MRSRISAAAARLPRADAGLLPWARSRWASSSSSGLEAARASASASVRLGGEGRALGARQKPVEQGGLGEGARGERRRARGRERLLGAGEVALLERDARGEQVTLSRAVAAVRRGETLEGRAHRLGRLLGAAAGQVDARRDHLEADHDGPGDAGAARPPPQVERVLRVAEQVELHRQLGPVHDHVGDRDPLAEPLHQRGGLGVAVEGLAVVDQQRCAATASLFSPMSHRPLLAPQRSPSSTTERRRARDSS